MLCWPSLRQKTRCVTQPSLMASRGMGVLPPIECYWLVNTSDASPLSYGRWVGQNSDPIFGCLWTTVYQYFWLTMFCCVPEIFAIKSRSCPKSRRFLMFWGRQISGGRGHPNFWPNFINLGRRRTCGKVWWRSAERLRRLGGEERKKKDLNINSRARAAIITRGYLQVHSSDNAFSSLAFFSPSYSRPAFSTPVFWCHIFTPAFSAPPSITQFYHLLFSKIGKFKKKLIVNNNFNH